MNHNLYVYKTKLELKLLDIEMDIFMVNPNYIGTYFLIVSALKNAFPLHDG